MDAPLRIRACVPETDAPLPVSKGDDFVGASQPRHRAESTTPEGVWAVQLRGEGAADVGRRQAGNAADGVGAAGRRGHLRWAHPNDLLGQGGGR